MLKALLITNAQGTKKIQEALGANIQITTTLSPDQYLPEVMHKYKVDLIITDIASLKEVLQQKSDTGPRKHVKAVTHQGIRLVPVENIFYFQAEHKYVIAEHIGGQLLIEDSLNSLEQEFANLFVRVHRKYLVAINKIESMEKNEQGQSFIRLRGRDDQLTVSRRQLAGVRKILLCL